MKKLIYLFLLTVFCISCHVNVISVDNASNKPKTYTVTYETEYGTCPKKITVTSGTVLKESQLQELNEYGYIFRGWFIDENKIEPESYAVKKNITLKAKWDYGYVISVAEFYELAPELKEFNKVHDGKDTVYIYITDEDPDMLKLREALVLASVENILFPSYIYLDLSRCILLESIEYGNVSGNINQLEDCVNYYNERLDSTTKSKYDDAFDYYYRQKVTKIDINCILSLILPESIKKIGDYAFSGTLGINELYLPPSITEFGQLVFCESYCKATIVLPEFLEEIPNGTFSWFGLCYGTADLIWPKNVKTIGDYAFYQCFFTGKEELIIPDSVETIKRNAFEINDLKRIKLPSSLKVIEKKAFYYSINISEITFPSSIISVGEKAFAECKELKKVTFSPGMNHLTIGFDAFSGCEKLECFDFSEVLKTGEKWKLDAVVFQPMGAFTDWVTTTITEELLQPYNYNLYAWLMDNCGNARLEYLEFDKL